MDALNPLGSDVDWDVLTRSDLDKLDMRGCASREETRRLTGLIRDLRIDVNDLQFEIDRLRTDLAEREAGL